MSLLLTSRSGFIFGELGDPGEEPMGTTNRGSRAVFFSLAQTGKGYLPNDSVISPTVLALSL